MGFYATQWSTTRLLSDPEHAGSIPGKPSVPKSPTKVLFERLIRPGTSRRFQIRPRTYPTNTYTQIEYQYEQGRSIQPARRIITYCSVEQVSKPLTVTANGRVQLLVYQKLHQHEMAQEKCQVKLSHNLLKPPLSFKYNNIFL